MASTTLLVAASSSSALSAKTSVFEQLRDFRTKVPRPFLNQWEQPTGLYSFVYMAQDWGIILVGHQIFVQCPTWVTFVLALILMSWGQRGLSNLAHDSIHGNLAAKRKWNDLIADTLLAPPLMSTARLQRQDHTAHHHYLGTKDDPDHGLHNDTSLKHYREGRFDHTDFLSLFLYDLLDPHLFVQSALGSLRAAPLQLLSWWLVAALVSGMLEPPVPLASSPPLSAVPFGWRFLALFHLARCTFSYAVYVLRETIDHSGLPAASVLAFTRTSPCCNALQRFLQPHDDNYHLLHHLLPRVPMSRLHAVHLWLVQNVPEYEQANRYTSYFHGDHALFAGPMHGHGLAKKTE